MKDTSTIRAVETMTHDLGPCELVRCRLKYKRQDIELVVVWHSQERVEDEFPLSKLKSW